MPDRRLQLKAMSSKSGYYGEIILIEEEDVDTAADYGRDWVKEVSDDWYKMVKRQDKNAGPLESSWVEDE